MQQPYTANVEGIRAAINDRAADLEDAGQATIALMEAIELADAFERDALDMSPADLARIASHFRDMSKTRRRIPQARDLAALADLCDWRAGRTPPGALVSRVA